MPRPRYQITDEDVAVTHRWVRERFRTHGWPEDWPLLTAWDRFPLDKLTSKTLQRWCDRFLDAAQWKQLQAVIRTARRDKSQSRTVHLSQNAYALLHHLAEREQLTLSETIERHLAEVATTQTRQDAPPPTEKTSAKTAAASMGSPERPHPAVVQQKRGSSQRSGRSVASIDPGGGAHGCRASTNRFMALWIQPPARCMSMIQTTLRVSERCSIPCRRVAGRHDRSQPGQHFLSSGVRGSSARETLDSPSPAAATIDGIRQEALCFYNLLNY